MGKTLDDLRELYSIINGEKVLFFDMDGTLIDTNFANFLSYKKAVQQLMTSNIDIPYDSSKRFNRKLLKKAIPNLSKMKYEKIIKFKSEL